MGQNFFTYFSMSFGLVFVATFLVGCAKSEPSTLRFHLVDAESKGSSDQSIPVADNNGKILSIDKDAFVTEACLAMVSAGEHPEGKYPILNFELTSDCQKQLADVTSKNIGRQFAVLVNGKLVTAPRINGPLERAEMFIELDRSEDEILEFIENLN